MGLLMLAGDLRRRGWDVHVIDCMDVDHPLMIQQSSLKAPKRRQYGTGKFWRQMVNKPEALKEIDRPYSRYGILPEVFINALKQVKNPSAILVTSLMTYWYPGVLEAIERAHEVHPHVPVILGGTYARLCEDHAKRFSGADRVISGKGIAQLHEAFKEYGISIPSETTAAPLPAYPAFDLLNKIHYVCLMTSTGCPYRCQYCASHFLFPEFEKRDPLEILEEILYWHGKWGVRDFAFYDDALLLSSKDHIGVLLERLLGYNLDIRFHTPNAIHVKEITKSMADLLHQSGFRTIRLGLETSDNGRPWDLDDKLSQGDFARAMHHLHGAGFGPLEIGVYIMAGLPEQSPSAVFESIRHADHCGGVPYLSEYSPIPHTPLWKRAVAVSAYDLHSEPLFHNNSLLPCWDRVQKAQFPPLKRLVSQVREKYRTRG